MKNEKASEYFVDVFDGCVSWAGLIIVDAFVFGVGAGLLIGWNLWGGRGIS